MLWTKKDDDYMKAHYGLLKNDLIAHKLNRTIMAIRRRARILKITRPNLWTIQNIKILIKLYGKIPVSKILELYEWPIGRSAIKNKAQSLGLDGRRLEMVSLSKRIPLNDDYFSILTKENCYFGGFLAADGCIDKNNNRIYWGSIDFEPLNVFRRAIKYQGDIKKIKRYYTIAFSSSQIKSDLKKYFNLVPRKSLILKPPTDLKQSHALSFIIGYIDGDGCIHKNKEQKIEMSMLGTKKMLKWIKQHFEKILGYKIINRVRLIKGKKYYCFKVTGKKAVEIGRYLKRINVPKLKRKWDKI